MRALISFCNDDVPQTNKLLLLDLDSGEEREIGAALPSRGVTGLAQDERYFHAVYQAPIPTLATFDRRTLELAALTPLPAVRDPHSLAVTPDGLLVVSTGTDQVLRYRYGAGSPAVEFEGLFWAPVGSAQQADTHHVNSVSWSEGRVYVSAFGPRRDERWSSARHGYVHDVTADLPVVRGIYHPHSAVAFRSRVYYCESVSRTVRGVGSMARSSEHGQELVRLASGYTRGLSLWDEHLVVGTSSGRTHSRSTRLVNNLADPGDLIPDCRAVVYRRSGPGRPYQAVKEFTFLPKRQEIYDVMAIAE